MIGIKKIKKIFIRLGLYNSLKILYDKLLSNKNHNDIFNKRMHFYNMFIGKDDLCFDIGANYGNRTEVFLSLGAKVIAFEPQPHVVEFLKKKFGNSIIIEQLALGAKEGFAQMYLSDSSTISSMSKQWIDTVKKTRFQNSNWNEKIDVNVSTLDIMLEKYGIPNFCKIDVEGFELQVLKGLNTPIQLLSFEFAVPEFTAKAIDCLEYMNKLGVYECNYSHGESMKLGLQKWISIAELTELIQLLPSQSIDGGDIYLRLIQN